MKNLLNKLPKKLLVLVLTVAIFAGLGTAAVANFGPDRPTRQWTEQENGFDYVTFNSFTGVPNGIGDERDFLRATINGSNQTWTDPVGDVTNNDKVTAKIYIHNNADKLLNDEAGQPGVARDVNVRIEIPTGLQEAHEVTSYISASNAQPKTIYDDLDITSLNDSLFELGYVPGSARLGGLNGTVLSDDIFTSGINIGDQKGCFEYVREITFELEVKKPGYLLQKSARIKGEGPQDWRKVVNAERGDVIEWRIYFENTGSTVLDDVSIIDDLPTYTEINPSSIELVNANNPNSYFYGPEAVQRGGDRVNVIIDDYNPGGQAFLFMESTIEDHQDIQCGNFQVANVAYAIPNYGDFRLDTINSNAKVNIINEECEEPEEVTACDGLIADRLSLNVGESTDLTAEASTTGPALEGFIFTVNGEEVQNSDSDTYTLTATEARSYEVRATAKFANGNKTSEECVKTITAVEETEPVYSCDMLTVSFVKDRTYKFTVDTTAQNGATVKSYHFDFGDDTDVLLTDKNVVEHSYAKDGTYKASVEVTFDVNGEMKKVSSKDCEKTLTFSEEIERCPIDGKGHLPKDDPDCREQVKGVKKKTTLPSTGAGSVAGAFAAITAVGATGHSLVIRRRK
jgi:uncharacterized repeat protein (TIGR01451 family)